MAAQRAVAYSSRIIHDSRVSASVYDPASRPFPASLCTLLAWGRGIEGALGDGSGENSSQPFNTGQTWPSSESPSVHAGMWHSGAISDGKLFMWGKGKSGRLGLGGDSGCFHPVEVPIKGYVVDVALGSQHSLALTRTPATSEPPTQSEDPPLHPFGHYSLYAWGLGDYGCLGLCHLSSTSEPEQVRVFEAITEGLPAEHVVNARPHIAAGSQHSIVLDRLGRVFSCGRDDGDGRLGLSVPALQSTNALCNFHQVALPEAATAVAAGGYMSFALGNSGQLHAWGSNGNGEQGSGEWSWSGASPNLVSALSDGRVKQVAAGGFHAAAVSHEGDVYTWGMGRHGSLGHGDTRNQHTPRRVAALRGVFIDKVCCGPTSTAAIARSGEVYVWGNNSEGMLGLGEAMRDVRYVMEPVQVQELHEASSVAMGAMHGLAVCM